MEFPKGFFREKGEGVRMKELIAPTINVLILVGVLFYYLRGPIRAHVQNRHLSLREELDKVRELLQKAKNQHEEFTSKLGALSAETGALRAQMSQDAAAAKQRLLADAQKLALGIAADAQAAALGLYQDLRTQLFGEVGTRVVERAEVLLRERLTGDDKARLRREFSRQVETVQ